MDTPTIGARLRDGSTSAASLAAAALGKATAAAGLNAFIKLLPTAAGAAAQAADSKLGAGDAGPLAGVPYAVKDNYCTAGITTTCASKLLDGYVPPYESHVTGLLAAAGMVCVGKANLDEFAMGTTGENSAFGPTLNPWDHARCAGGSSSGSAAAVAARIVPVAIGSDTGGSVRLPAAYCGISSIKPTYGSISRRGIVAYASSLDQAGVFATTAADLRATLGVLMAHDPADSTSLGAAAPPADLPAQRDLQGLRIGVAKEFFGPGIMPAVSERVRAAVATLTAQGAVEVEVSIPHLDHAIAAYYIIACAEASSNLARFDGLLYGNRAPADDLDSLVERSRSAGFGAEVQRRIMLGTFVLSHGYVDAYYRQAQKVRQLLGTDFAAAFASCDVLAAPGAPTTAPLLGAFADDPVAMYGQDICTVTANLCGQPALVVPCGLVDGLPAGLQLIGPAHAEGRLLGVAEAYQGLTDFHQASPPGVAD